MSAIYSAYGTLCQMRCLRRNYSHEPDIIFDLIGTEYFLRLDVNAKITWAKRQSWNHRPSKVSFEEVLFHLDLFI